MIISLNHRVYMTEGVILNSVNDFRVYNSRYPLRIMKNNLKEIEFKIKEGVIHIVCNGEELPLSMMALKGVCTLLKIPASWLNKQISEDTILNVLNKSSYKVDEPIEIYIRSSDDFEFISAVSNNDQIKAEDVIDVIESTHFLMNNEVELEEITHANDETMLYFLRRSETLSTGMLYRRGIAICFGEGVDKNFTIHQFYRFYFDGDDSYDFYVKKPLKKVSRKEKSYKIMITDEIRHFDLNKYEKNFENILNLVRTANTTSEISFGFLKQIKSTITRTFQFQAGMYDTSMIIPTILPEFDMFQDQHKEELKLMPSYEHNNLMLPFYLPQIVFNV